MIQTLADDVLAALPDMMTACPTGPMAADIAKLSYCGLEHARDAARSLDDAGRALFVRYPGSKARRLIPLDFLPKTRRACANCRVVFDLPKGSVRQCCTRTCSISWSWKRPDVADRRVAAIQARKSTPEARAKQAENNRRRWSREGERERASQKNRDRWADPVSRAKLSASIQAVNGTPEKRAEASAIKRALWTDPAYREKATAAMQASKRTPEARAKFSELLRARWQAPKTREKLMAAVKRNSARAAEAVAKKMQSPEHIAKRVEARKASLKVRPLKQSAEHIRKRVEATRLRRLEKAGAPA